MDLFKEITPTDPPVLDGFIRPFWRMQGTTVLHLVSQSGHLDVLQRLLAAAAAPDLEDLQGRATQIDGKKKLISIFVCTVMYTYTS